VRHPGAALFSGVFYMSNNTIKNALSVGLAPLGGEVELLDEELDDITGGCGNFTCYVYRVAER
jgi:hypothetical protein